MTRLSLDKIAGKWLLSHGEGDQETASHVTVRCRHGELIAETELRQREHNTRDGYGSFMGWLVLTDEAVIELA